MPPWENPPRTTLPSSTPYLGGHVLDHRLQQVLGAAVFVEVGFERRAPGIADHAKAEVHWNGRVGECEQVAFTRDHRDQRHEVAHVRAVPMHEDDKGVRSPGAVAVGLDDLVGQASVVEPSRLQWGRASANRLAERRRPGGRSVPSATRARRRRAARRRPRGPGSRARRGAAASLGMGLPRRR